MAKRVKMVLYGEPGVGKSVFASKAPKPFFITTDGNYEWLEDFGADPKAHAQVSSWAEAKKILATGFPGYETVVIDLTEDLFKWCEYEYCARNKIEHVSDQGYGKAYDITRNEFFIEICKLLAMDKNVILIMHGYSYNKKDRRGVDHLYHSYTARMPDKLVDMIEGRVRYFLRCYLKADDMGDGTLVKRRYLSLVPKENEFGICRGIDESKVPHDILLEWSEFAKWIGLDSIESTSKYETVTVEVDEPVETTVENSENEAKPIETAVETTSDDDDVAPFETNDASVEPEPKVVAKVEEPKPAPQTTMSSADRIAAIKAKLAALKNNN